MGNMHTAQYTSNDTRVTTIKTKQMFVWDMLPTLKHTLNVYLT